MERHRIDLFDDFANAHPDRQISKNVNYAALVRKRRLLQYRKVFHQAIAYNVLHDLIHKVNLTAVQTGVIKIHGESLFCGLHIQADNFTNKLAQRLGTDVGLRVFLRCDLTAKIFLQWGNICR